MLRGSILIETILNPLEYVATLVLAKSVNFKQAYVLFGDSFLVTGRNKEIWRFIFDLRARLNLPTLFDGFEQVYNKFESFRPHRMPPPINPMRSE